MYFELKYLKGSSDAAGTDNAREEEIRYYKMRNKKLYIIEEDEYRAADPDDQKGLPG